MNKHTDPIVLAEQQVAEARTAVLAEYQAARANLRRQIGSPLLIGGVLLGALVLGYLCRSRSEPMAVVYPASPGVLTQMLKTLQRLLR